jgi:hypothetical protein
VASPTGVPHREGGPRLRAYTSRVGGRRSLLTRQLLVDNQVVTRAQAGRKCGARAGAGKRLVRGSTNSPPQAGLVGKYPDSPTSFSCSCTVTTQPPPSLAPSSKPTGWVGGDGETAPPRTYTRPQVDGPTYAQW